MRTPLARLFSALGPSRALATVGLAGLAVAAALTGPTLRDLALPGTQALALPPDVIRPSWECSGCHGWFHQPSAPFDTWEGSLMANAGRDPLFFAQMTLANQDVPGAGYFCMRCHVPTSFVTGSALAGDGSGMQPLDEDGVNCHFCHSMVDPVYEPGVSPARDRLVLAQLGSIPKHHGNAMFVLDPEGVRRGPRSDADVQHEVIPSPFHKQGSMCGTCHDVGSPVITRLPDGTYQFNAMNRPTPTEDPWEQFPLERTYTEWKLSAFANGGVDMGGRFGGSGPTVMESCQDCHMPKTTGSAGWNTPPRPDLARHDFAGASAWVLEIIALHSANDPYVNQDALRRGRRAAIEMVERAASLELGHANDRLLVRVVNESGHKLPTGHIEGRRVFVNVQCFDAAGALQQEYGHYDFATAELDEASTTVFEMHVGLSPDHAAALGLPPGRTGHMVLANTIEKDNRIPPRGYDRAAFERAGAPAVGAFYDDGQHWADLEYALPPGTARAVVSVYYQTVTREYIEELRDNNHTDHWGQTLYDLWLATDKGRPILMCREERSFP